MAKDDLLRAWEEAEKRAGVEGLELSDYTKGVLMMYDIASMNAGIENPSHKREFVKIALFSERIAGMAEMVLRTQSIDKEADKIVSLGKVLFR